MKKCVSTLIIGSMLSLCFTVNSTSIISTSNSSDECYGFIIPVTQYQSNDLQMEISKLVNELLRNDIEVFWITYQIYVSSKALDENSSVENNYFEKGSYIVPFVDNQSKNIILTSIIYKHEINDLVESYELMESINNIQVYKLVEPKIAYHNGPYVDSASYPTCLRNCGFLNGDFLSWEEIPDKLNNEDYNVFVWGGGFSVQSFSEETRQPLKSQKVTDAIRAFIKNGGGYVGSCYGSSKASVSIYGNKIYCLMNNLLKNYKLSSSPFLGCDFGSFNSVIYTLFSDFLTSPGVVISKIVNSDSPVTYGLNEYLPTWHWAGSPTDWCGPNTVPIAKFYDVSDNFSWNPNAPEFMKNLWMKRTMGRASIVSSELGEGKVVTFVSHPEMYFFVETYSNYSPSTRLVSNSVFYVTSKGPLFICIEKNVTFSNHDIKIEAPIRGNVSDLIKFQCDITQGLPPHTYLWDFDDGKKSTISNPSINYSYSEPGEYLVLVTVIDSNFNLYINFLKINISGEPVIPNRPPAKPVLICDKNIGKTGGIVFFIVTSEDPDDDLFWYKIEQDDELVEINTTRLLFFEAGQRFQGTLDLVDEGTTVIRAKAVDVHGAESEWSDPAEIIVTRHPYIYRIFKNV